LFLKETKLEQQIIKEKSPRMEAELNKERTKERTAQEHQPRVTKDGGRWSFSLNGPQGCSSL
jgi:hypothetical protein